MYLLYNTFMLGIFGILQMKAPGVSEIWNNQEVQNLHTYFDMKHEALLWNRDSRLHKCRSKRLSKYLEDNNGQNYGEKKTFFSRISYGKEIAPDMKYNFLHEYLIEWVELSNQPDILNVCSFHSLSFMIAIPMIPMILDLKWLYNTVIYFDTCELYSLTF